MNFIALWREGRDYAFNTLDDESGQAIYGHTIEECWQKAKAEMRRPGQECGVGHQLIIVSPQLVIDL